MMSLAFAMLLVGVAWIVLFALLAGTGTLIRQWARLPITDEQQLFDTFWLGTAIFSAFLLIWHLFFAINAIPIVVLALVGVLGLVRSAPALLRKSRPSLRAVWPLIALLLGAGIWLSNQAIDTPGYFHDSGLYHFQSVRWANTYAAIPGLGNLHGRYAFNSSYHLFMATLNVGPWTDRWYHVSTSLLVMVMLASIFTSAYRLLRRPEEWRWSDAINVLLLPAVMEVALGSQLSAPATDPPVLLLGIVLARQLIAFIERSMDRREAYYHLGLIAALAALGITIKLSFATYGVTVAVVAFVWWALMQPRPAWWRRVFTGGLWIALPVALLLAPWVIRGIILSGYPAYPSTIGAVSVDWRVPQATAEEETKWIKSWARNDDEHWSEVLGNWAWFKPWAEWNADIDGIRIPLAMVAAALVIAGYQASERRGLPPIKPFWLLGVPVAAALIYWFIMAPDYRFAGSTFWIMGAAALITALSGITPSKGMAVGLVALGIGLSLLRPVDLLNAVGPGPDHGFYPPPVPDLEQIETASGLVISVPTTTDQCWDAPLPCAPAGQPFLELRREGDLGSGFRVAP